MRFHALLHSAATLPAILVLRGKGATAACAAYRGDRGPAGRRKRQRVVTGHATSTLPYTDIHKAILSIFVRLMGLSVTSGHSLLKIYTLQPLKPRKPANACGRYRDHRARQSAFSPSSPSGGLWPASLSCVTMSTCPVLMTRTTRFSVRSSAATIIALSAGSQRRRSGSVRA